MSVIKNESDYKKRIIDKTIDKYGLSKIQGHSQLHDLQSVEVH